MTTTTTSESLDIKNLNIQKLKDTEGYPTWKTRLMIALKAMSLWDIVDGTRKVDGLVGEVLAKWTKDNDRAMFFIIAAISDEVLMNSEQTTAKSLWDSIKSAYGVAKEEKVYHVYHRIITTKMSSSDNASDHVAKYKTMFQQVEAMDEKLSEKFKIAVLLVSLPESYNVKRQILYEKENQKFQDVCDSVIGHVPEGHTSASESADKALAAFAGSSKKGGGGKKGKGKYKGPPCEHCGKSTHSISTCYQVHGYPESYRGPRVNGNGGKGGEGKSGASTAVEREWLLAATVLDDGKESDEMEFASSAGTRTSRDEWWTDSGATRNITAYLEILHDVRTLDRPVRIDLAAQNAVMLAYQVGTVRLRTNFGILVLHDVLYIKEAAQNLFGLKPLIRKGGSAYFTPSGAYIWAPNGDLMAFAPEKANENQWILADTEAILPDRIHAKVATQSHLMSVTHRRFGHPGRDRLEHAVQAYGIKNVGHVKVGSCQGCDLSKSHRQPFPTTPTSDAKDVMEIIHSDIWGPHRVATFSGM